jgi:hydroxyacylglutathione hydrolase
MNIEIIPVNLGFVKSFLVKGDKTIIVDAGLKGFSKKILRVMEANGIKPADVSLLLVTHTHGDHTGGLKELKDITGAPVAVHAVEAQYLSNGQSAPALMRSPIMKFMSVFFRGQKIAIVQPDVLIDERLDLNAYGVDGYVFGTPGHSAGSVTLVTASGDAITGDMVGGGAKPGLPGVSCDIDQLKASISTLGQHAIQKVYTSHAGVYDIEDVLKLGVPAV